MTYYDNEIEFEANNDEAFEYLKAWLVSKAEDGAAAKSIAEAVFTKDECVDECDLRFVFDGNDFYGEPAEISVGHRRRTISLYGCSRHVDGLQAVHAVMKEIGHIASVTGRVISDDGSLEGHWYDNGKVVSVKDLIEDSWEPDDETGEDVLTDIGKRLESIFDLARTDFKRDFDGDEENPMPEVSGIAGMWDVLNDRVDGDPEYESNWHYLGEKIENEFRCLQAPELRDEVTWMEYRG